MKKIKFNFEEKQEKETQFLVDLFFINFNILDEIFRTKISGDERI